jgi:peptidyl-prolyl cis-trans isomerase C
VAEKNSNQNIVTAVAIIVALAAILYALTVHMSARNNVVDMDNATIAESEEAETNNGEAFAEGENNPIVMVVNGREITRMEIMNDFAQASQGLPEGMDMEQIFPLLQEQYLVTYLMNNAAHNSGIDGTDPEVAERIEEAREQAIRAVYVNRLTDEAVTDNDIRQAYEDIVGNAEPVIERRARHILVETQEDAQALIEQLNDGADFAELATENSTGPTGPNGGDLGYFTAEAMVPAFSEAAFSTEVGQYTTEPVQTQFGFHVIKVEDEREREKPSFEEVRGQIEENLNQAVIREKVQELREQTDVTVFDYNGEPIVVEEPSAEEGSETLTDEAEMETEAQAEPQTNEESQPAPAQ